MATFPARDAKLQPGVIAPNPDTSADVQARKLLRREAKTLPGVSHVAASNGQSVGGAKVSGGARITGGKG